LLVVAAAGSLAVSQRASEPLVHQDLIYDVGMNNGDDTAYYLRRGFRVVAIEADPRLAKSTAERFGTQISSGQLRILNIGIAAEEGELPFWICETHSEWSSFDRKNASRYGCSHHEVMVPCRRFASVLEEFGVPYYLKVDIEGNDILATAQIYVHGNCWTPRPDNADGWAGLQALQSHKSVQLSPDRTPTRAGTAPV
jgi:FkbM family methyltransferase